MNNLNNKDLINNILCYINPKMPISNSHYVCGSNLAIFSSLAQVENCLTGFTNKCKFIKPDINFPNFRNDEKKQF